MNQNAIYDSIMAGLNEAIKDAQSDKPFLKRQKISVVPVKIYNAFDVKKIRKTTGMSQNAFASYLGVSGKTVEAWESGINHPSGSSSRILSMLEMDPALINKYPFVKAAGN